jgi:hypothetical protein
MQLPQYYAVNMDLAEVESKILLDLKVLLDFFRFGRALHNSFGRALH